MKIQAWVMLVAIGLFSVAAMAHKEIIIIAQEEMPLAGPEKGPIYGYGIDILREIFALSDIQVTYKVLPRAQAISMVRIGTYDCLLGAYPIDPPDFIFSEGTIGISNVHVFKRPEDRWIYRGVDDLKGRKLGIISGTAYDGGALDHYIASQGTRAVQAARGKEAVALNIQKLLSKQIDLVIEDKSVMESKLEQLSLKGFIVSAGVVSAPTPRYLACSPVKTSSGVITRLFDAGISSLRKNGKLEEILKRYGLSDWAQETNSK